MRRAELQRLLSDYYKIFVSDRLRAIDGQENVPSRALEVSSYGYVLETVKAILEGPSADLKANPEVQAAYLGI